MLQKLKMALVYMLGQDAVDHLEADPPTAIHIRIEMRQEAYQSVSDPSIRNVWNPHAQLATVAIEYHGPGSYERLVWFIQRFPQGMLVRERDITGGEFCGYTIIVTL